MNESLEFILVSIFISGIYSCIVLDILGYLLKTIGVPEPSWGVLGRWTYYMLINGSFFNPKIDQMLEYKHEVLLGWICHYFISICWAIIYYLCFVLIGFKMSYFSGLIFGAITTLAPLLVFLPFTGQGIFAKNTEKPMKTSIIFFGRHSIYGVAMYQGFSWFLL